MTDDAPVTVADKYARAINSTDLTPGAVHERTDAEVLLAAGAAAAKDQRRMLALAAYRLRVRGDTAGLGAVVSEIDGWLLERLSRKGNRPMPRAAREELVVATLRWWFNPTCRYCSGLGYVVTEGASRLSTVECECCHGTKQRPLQREIPRPYVEHALWITDKLNELMAGILGDMAKLLARDMEL